MPFRARFQKAVCWAKSSVDQFGNPTVTAPVELDVRWEKGLSREITPNINPIAVADTVWVDQEIALGSMMRYGELIDLPAVPDEIREVVDYVEIPDVKGRVRERVVLLAKYADRLPTVV